MLSVLADRFQSARVASALVLAERLPVLLEQHVTSIQNDQRDHHLVRDRLFLVLLDHWLTTRVAFYFPSFLYFSTANDIDHSIIMAKNNKFSKQHLANNMNLLNTLVDQIESKLEKAIELFEKIGDVAEKNKAMQMSHLNEFISALNFLQSVLDWLFSYESKALQPYNSAIARLVSLVSAKLRHVS